jgi:hypothetical protein
VNAGMTHAPNPFESVRATAKGSGFRGCWYYCTCLIATSGLAGGVRMASKSNEFRL